MEGTIEAVECLGDRLVAVPCPVQQFRKFTELAATGKCHGKAVVKKAACCVKITRLHCRQKGADGVLWLARCLCRDAFGPATHVILGIDFLDRDGHEIGSGTDRGTGSIGHTLGKALSHPRIIALDQGAFD